LTASRQSSVSFTPLHELYGIITPNGVCFERHHASIAEVNPADYRLIIHTVLAGIGSELVHDEGEGLRCSGVEHHIGCWMNFSNPHS